MVFGTVGGLAMFLYGMGLLSDGLKLTAGNGLRRLLGKVTKWPILALGIGATVTCLVQSSSATTVMVVGLINTGLLTLKQAISVVLGANIGTTMTAWLVAAAAGAKALKISNYALPTITIGFLMMTFGRRDRVKYVGQILLGLGLLFIGIRFMKDASGGLRESDHVRSFFTMLGDRPIWAVLAGAAVTMLLQSSSASIAMIQLMAVQGTFGDDPGLALRIAIPFVLGDNIGTTITAQLAAMRTNINGKRAAMAHTLFNVLGVCLVLPLVYLRVFDTVVRSVCSGWGLPSQIAFAHSAFNVVAALAMLPLVGLLATMVTRLLPSKAGEEEILIVTLEEHLLDTPALAMVQARKELVRMAKCARDAVNGAVEAIRDNDRKVIQTVNSKEEQVDRFQTEITRYLVQVSRHKLSPETSNELPVLLHSVNDIERVSDHATNIAEIAVRKMDQRTVFSEEASREISLLQTEVDNMFDDVLAAVTDTDVAVATRALVHEEAVNRLQVELRRNYVQRLGEDLCTPAAGMIFVDFVDNMEKIGDHLANIAQGVIAGLQWGRLDDEVAPDASRAQSRAVEE